MAQVCSIIARRNLIKDFGNRISVAGNEAWVSGVITKGSIPGADLAGLPVITRVRDNGTSQNDPPDEISFSFIGDPRSCVEQPADLPLFGIPQGQVVVE